MILSPSDFLTFHQKYADFFAAINQPTTTEYIEAWNAPCYTQRLSGEQVIWEPVQQGEKAVNFEGVESALSIDLNESFKTLFTTVWAGDLYLHLNEPLIVLQVQAPEDAERLQANLIGHLMMKEKLKQAATLFIGLTDEEDKVLTVHNETGEVGFEYVGKNQHEVIAPSLCEFLKHAVPNQQGYE